MIQTSKTSSCKVKKGGRRKCFYCRASTPLAWSSVWCTLSSHPPPSVSCPGPSSYSPGTFTFQDLGQLWQHSMFYSSILLHFRAVKGAFGVPDHLTDIFGKVRALRELPSWYFSIAGPARCQSHGGVWSDLYESGWLFYSKSDSQSGKLQEWDMQRQQTIKDWEESTGEGEDDGGRTTEETSDSDRGSLDRKIIYKSIKYYHTSYWMLTIFQW